MLPKLTTIFKVPTTESADENTDGHWSVEEWTENRLDEEQGEEEEDSHDEV